MGSSVTSPHPVHLGTCYMYPTCPAPSLAVFLTLQVIEGAQALQHRHQARPDPLIEAPAQAFLMSGVEKNASDGAFLLLRPGEREHYFLQCIDCFMIRASLRTVNEKLVMEIPTRPNASDLALSANRGSRRRLAR